MSDANLGSIGGSVSTKEKIVIDEKELTMSGERQTPNRWRKKLADDLKNDLENIIKAEDHSEGDDWILASILLEKLMLLPSGRWKRRVLPSGKLTDVDLVRLLTLNGIRSVRLKYQGRRENFYRKEDFIGEANPPEVEP